MTLGYNVGLKQEAATKPKKSFSETLKKPSPEMVRIDPALSTFAFVQGTIFFLLAVQNTGIILFSRWVKVYSPLSIKDEREGVMLSFAEFLKLIASLVCVFFLTGRTPTQEDIEKEKNIKNVPIFSWIRIQRSGVLSIKEFARICPSAILYLIQNQLIFFSYGKLPGPLMQVLYQTKLLAGALFLWVLLGRSISKTRWLALGVLTAGVSIVQTDGHALVASLSSAAENPNVNLSIGFAAVLCASSCSGLAGCYLEKVLKSSGGHQGQADLWVRNVHMAIASVIGYGIQDCFIAAQKSSIHSSPESAAISTFLDLITGRRFIQELDSPAITIAILQAYGGLLVSLLIKYTDTLVKGLASSFSLVLGSIVSVYLFPEDFRLTPGFSVGATLVAGSMYVYATAK